MEHSHSYCHQHTSWGSGLARNHFDKVWSIVHLATTSSWRSVSGYTYSMGVMKQGHAHSNDLRAVADFMSGERVTFASERSHCSELEFSRNGALLRTSGLMCQVLVLALETAIAAPDEHPRALWASPYAWANAESGRILFYKTLDAQPWTCKMNGSACCVAVRPTPIQSFHRLWRISARIERPVATHDPVESVKP